MKIRLIAGYFGKWPVWLPAFLQSCRYNPEIEWLIFNDCPIPASAPSNVTFEHGTLSSVRSLASAKLELPVGLTRPYKLCDLRPAYGVIFADYLKGYDFWGHCDLDIIWGDIRAFITNEILEKHDIVSARKGKLCGHFNLYRNTERVNESFRLDPRHREFFSREESFYYDEVGATKLVQQLVARSELRVYWPGLLFNHGRPDTSSKILPSKLGPYTGRWEWEKGRLFDCRGGRHQIMYLHFMTWKNSLRYCGFGIEDDPDSFVTSFSHIGLHRSDKPPTPLLTYYLDILRVAWKAYA